MLKNWKTWITWLYSSVAIGIYVTLVTMYLTVDFYNMNAQGEGAKENHGLNSILYMAHQKSVDHRLRVRGERKVAPNLAMLTIDDRAVNVVGRWPWPREIVAKAIDNAFKYGAKVLSFDIVFSEPSVNPADVVLGQLKKDGLANENLENVFKTYKAKLDGDLALGEVYKKYADNIVAGSFYSNGVIAAWAPETEFCHDMIYKLTPEAKQWDKEEVLTGINDPYTPYMPQMLTETFQTVVTEKRSSVQNALGTPKSRNEAESQRIQIMSDLYDTCDKIFQDYGPDLAANWKTILDQENPKEFTFSSYEDWLADYASKSKPNSVMTADIWSLNIPEIAAGTKHTGFFNTDPDSDGSVRSKPLIVRSGSSYYPSISLKAYLVANNYNATAKLSLNPATGNKEVQYIEITNNDTGDVVFQIPTSASGKLLVNYAGSDQMFPYLSFADLLSDSPDADIEVRQQDPASKRWVKKIVRMKKAEFLKDKIFIVGATAVGIYDLRVTAFSENFPGAETHLNVIDNLIQKNYFHTSPDERVIMPLVLLGLGVILSIALSYLGAIAGLLLTAGSLAAIGAYDYYFLFGKNTVVAIIWPLALVSGMYVALTFFRYLTEERGKKELRQTFQKYVSPAIVEEILSDPKNIELGGKKVHLTVMFSDVRGFTTISEKLDPRALSDLLNSYLTPMTELVFKNRGTLDKYMGDAIMAFFGAPIGYKDHAKYACRCALQSIDKLFELQKEWEKQGLPNIDLGIGLNTGDVSVGNMGSETVRSYTVMGDAVNLASRLEGINKTYGTRIILSEMTYNEVKDSFVCREVDWVRVKGKVLPVKIYELISEDKVPNASVAETLKWFQEGYVHYHARAWQKGIDCFSKALDLTPTDAVAKLYLERCQDYLTEPPEDSWDGVFIMKTK